MIFNLCVTSSGQADAQKKARGQLCASPGEAGTSKNIPWAEGDINFGFMGDFRTCQVRAFRFYQMCNFLEAPAQAKEYRSGSSWRATARTRALWRAELSLDLKLKGSSSSAWACLGPPGPAAYRERRLSLGRDGPEHMPDNILNVRKDAI
eukprot:s17_g35.t1